MTHICVSKLTIIGSDNAWSAPSHYLNQCWNIVNSDLRNKLQWNPRRNSFFFILENTFENVVCDMASIWSRPQWVKVRVSMSTSNRKKMMWFFYLCSIFMDSRKLLVYIVSREVHGNWGIVWVHQCPRINPVGWKASVLNHNKTSDWIRHMSFCFWTLYKNLHAPLLSTFCVLPHWETLRKLFVCRP